MMDSIAFKTLKRPNSPNTYLLAPKDLCEQAAPDMLSDIMNFSTEAMFQAVLDIVAAEKNWVIQDQSQSQHLLHIVVTSPLMRFKDDVHVLILPAEAEGAPLHDHCHLAVYSSSRVGHSDLGANAKRVKYFLECLDKKQIRA